MVARSPPLSTAGTLRIGYAASALAHVPSSEDAIPFSWGNEGNGEPRAPWRPRRQLHELCRGSSSQGAEQQRAMSAALTPSLRTAHANVARLAERPRRGSDTRVLELIVLRHYRVFEAMARRWRDPQAPPDRKTGCPELVANSTQDDQDSTSRSRDRQAISDPRPFGPDPRIPKTLPSAGIGLRRVDRRSGPARVRGLLRAGELRPDEQRT